MIKFFRKIRQRLLTKNNPTSRATAPGSVGRFSKYLLYAIGEIVLVVIGILIALQINTSNQNRINNKTELYYLNQMRNDLATDSLILFQEKLKFQNNLPIILNFLAELHKNDNKESFNQAIRSYINHVFKPLSFVSNNATFNEMKSSAKLGLIRDNVLRNGIVNLYNHLEETKNLYSTQYDFISSIDVALISGRGLAKYHQAQNSLFSQYNSEDELYLLKGFKAELESNAANWHWSIVELQPELTAQIQELREVIAEIDAYVKNNNE
ncbi:MAG: DUF6090 family protein [Maribacter sp.]|nr:DUF6090 family protein [Maribacter sp.]